MKGVVERHDRDLVPPAGLEPVGAAQLHGALHRLGARSQQEDLLQWRRQQGGQLLHQAAANLAWEAVVGKQPVLGLGADGLHDLGAAVTGVGDQHAAGPVEPAVSPAIVNIHTLGAVPHHRRLALHGYRFGGVEALQYGNRLGNRNRRDDPAMAGLHRRHLAWFQIKVRHGSLVSGVVRKLLIVPLCAAGLWLSAAPPLPALPLGHGDFMPGRQGGCRDESRPLEFLHFETVRLTSVGRPPWAAAGPPAGFSRQAPRPRVCLRLLGQPHSDRIFLEVGMVTQRDPGRTGERR